MSKGGFYGVYGKNGGGVYVCSWPTLKDAMIHVKGVKVKKLKTRDSAVQFIVDGIAHDYHVCGEDEIRKELLMGSTNRFLNVDTLRAHRYVGSNELPFYISQ